MLPAVPFQILKSKDSCFPSICHLLRSLLEIQTLGSSVLVSGPLVPVVLDSANSDQLLASIPHPQTIGGFSSPTALCFAQRPGVSGLTTAKCISLDAICLQFVNPAGKHSPDAWQTPRLYLVPGSCLFRNESQLGPRCRPRTHPQMFPTSGGKSFFFSKQTNFFPCFLIKEQKPHGRPF